MAVDDGFSGDEQLVVGVLESVQMLTSIVWIRRVWFESFILNSVKVEVSQKFEFDSKSIIFASQWKWFGRRCGRESTMWLGIMEVAECESLGVIVLSRVIESGWESIGVFRSGFETVS